jgi:glycosyltransferase involved in cell wall biosynthesis
VLTVHDRSWERRPQDFSAYERAWHAVARPRALARGAAAVTADCHAVAAELHAEWGVHAAVVSPGISALPATPRAGRYLLFVGAHDPRKALDVLTAAHASAQARGLDAELVVVGDGLRRVDDAELAALYAGALAVVAPSYLEGFGLPPLEAAAHGTPAVVSDLACFAETLGDAALRVPVGDADALADAIATTVKNGDGGAAGRAKRKAHARRYTWTGCARSTLAVYQRALDLR